MLSGRALLARGQTWQIPIMRANRKSIFLLNYTKV